MLHNFKKLCRPLPAPELGRGWTRVKHVRPSGRSEWIFHAPGGRAFRSKKQAQAHADMLQGKQPIPPADSTVTSAAAATAAMGSQQTGKEPSSGKRPGSMLPPPCRPPRQVKHQGAAVRGIPLLPSLERTQCQERHLNRATAQCIAEAVQRCIQGVAEESLSREQELRDRIHRLLEENQKLRLTKARDRGIASKQPSEHAAGGQTLAGACLSLNAVIHSTAIGSRR